MPLRILKCWERGGLWPFDDHISRKVVEGANVLLKEKADTLFDNFLMSKTIQEYFRIRIRIRIRKSICESGRRRAL